MSFVILPSLSRLCERIVVMGRISSAPLAFPTRMFQSASRQNRQMIAPQLTTGRPFKSRRNRVRARKAAKAVAEPAGSSGPVLWVQTAPGKFVRVDAGTPANDSAEDDCAAGSVTEDYGIAPSIFGLAPPANVAVEGTELSLRAELRRQRLRPSIAWTLIASHHDDAECGSSVQRAVAPRMWGIQNLRGIARAVRHLSRGSRRGSRQPASTYRIAAETRFTPNTPQRAVVRLAPVDCLTR